MFNHLLFLGRLSYAYEAEMVRGTDFISSLIIAHNRSASSKNLLALSFYNVLTSKQDMFPLFTEDSQETQRATNVFMSVGDSSPTNVTQEQATKYVGFYSTHEQSMNAVLKIQASTTKKSLWKILHDASVACRSVSQVGPSIRYNSYQ